MPQVAKVMPVLTAESIQVHMEATGEVSAEQKAMIPQMMAMWNIMLAMHSGAEAKPSDVSATTQHEDTSEADALLAKLNAERKEEILLAQEVAKLNAEKEPPWGSAQAVKPSNRADPMQ